MNQNLPASRDEPEVYDTIIIGGGPAGCAAAVYTARKEMKTLLITESFANQSITSDDIQNWIGEVHISGIDLARKLEAHVRAYSDKVEIKEGEKAKVVQSVGRREGRLCDFQVQTDKGMYKSKTLIIATGARRRKLDIPGEDSFAAKGVAYCSTCDAPLFKDKKVLVIGGGNAGLEAVQDLFPYASEVYLMERGESLRGDEKTIEEIEKNTKLKEIILNAQALEILGETLVSKIKYKDLKTGIEKFLEVQGIFIEIGSVPNSEIVKNLVQLDEHGEIMINFKHASTSHPGVFAAGDVTDDPYKQNNISVGDGVKAALSAYNYLLNRQKQSPAVERHDYHA